MENIEERELGPGASIIWRELLGNADFCRYDVEERLPEKAKPGVREMLERKSRAGICCLIGRLKKPPDEAAGFIRESLSGALRARLDGAADPADPPAGLLGSILSELNGLMAGPSLYDERRFSHLNLSKEALTLARLRPAQGTDDCLRLNRILIEAALPDGIKMSKGFNASIHELVKHADVRRRRLPKECAAASPQPMDYVETVILKVADGRRHWDPDRGALLTFLKQVIESEVSHWLESFRRQQDFIDRQRRDACGGEEPPEEDDGTGGDEGLDDS